MSNNKSTNVKTSTVRMPEEDGNHYGIASRQYSEFLAEKEINFQKFDGHLWIGDECKQTDNVVHISVIKQEFYQILHEIIKIQNHLTFTFSIPENDRVHAMILDGSFGFNAIGKVISIYPDSPESAIKVVNLLSPTTANLRGPDIPGTVHLGNSLYLSTSEKSTWKLLTLLGKSSKRFFLFKSSYATITGKPARWLVKRYFLLQCLKNDAKGSVYKALDVKNWLNVQWCVVKQGKKNQCVDHAQRDIGDRLRWQFKVHRELTGKVAIPKAINLFEHEGDTFLAMEYIDGKAFNDHVSDISRGVIWHRMGHIEKQATIDLILQIIDVVDKLHQLGYVHRDLNPVNFMVTPQLAVFAIDIELSYSIKEGLPSPCFTLGTSGYMSPQQKAVNIPVIEDDVYGIGSLLVRSLTGLSPTKFNLGNDDKFINKLNYFIKNEQLSNIIASCFEKEAHLRPTLQEIKTELGTNYKLCEQTAESDNRGGLESLPKELIDQIIIKAITALGHYPFVNGEQVWHSKTRTISARLSNALKSVNWYNDIYRGASGTIYTLLMAHDSGYDVNSISEIMYFEYQKSLQSLHGLNLSQSNSFYNGVAGFAMLAAYLYNYEQFSNLPQPDWDILLNILTAANEELNLAHGICGQGFALMKISLLLGKPELDEQIHRIAKRLIEQQLNDGSWLIRNELTGPKGVKPTGLMNGISGIAYFLLHYGSYYENAKAKQSSNLALNWLLSQRKITPSGFDWPVNSSNGSVDPWFENGFTGIAFLMIHAYEDSRAELYRNAAYELLLKHPRNITSNYFSQAAGLSGLGEVYLEAYDVFRDKEWIDRAGIIAAFFAHTYKESAMNSIYWLDGNNDVPNPGLMNGHAGIIHFLIRYRFLDTVEFPLLIL